MTVQTDALRSLVCGLLVALVWLSFGCGDDAEGPEAMDEPAGDGDGDGDGDVDHDGDASARDDAGALLDANLDDGAAGGASGASGQNGGGNAGNDSGNGGHGGSSGSTSDGGGGDSGELDGDAAIVDIDAGPLEATCFGGGETFEPSAGQTGACATPFVIDWTDGHIGDVLVHQSPSATTNAVIASVGKCGEQTERDIVYQVRLPSEADLEISVHAADGSDPIILVQDGPDETCAEAKSVACVDDEGEGSCEYLRVRVAQGGFDESTAQVVIAETFASGAPLTVRFRLHDPQGGS